MEVQGYPKFKEFLKENNVKIKDLAEEMGVSRSHFSKKLHRIAGADFKPDEIRFICKKFRLDANEFFLLSPLLISNEVNHKATKAV